jgi:hypothetical protein
VKELVLFLNLLVDLGVEWYSSMAESLPQSSPTTSCTHGVDESTNNESGLRIHAEGEGTPSVTFSVFALSL